MHRTTLHTWSLAAGPQSSQGGYNCDCTYLVERRCRRRSVFRGVSHHAHEIRTAVEPQSLTHRGSRNPYARVRPGSPSSPPRPPVRVGCVPRRPYSPAAEPALAAALWLRAGIARVGNAVPLAARRYRGPALSRARRPQPAVRRAARLRLLADRRVRRRRREGAHCSRHRLPDVSDVHPPDSRHSGLAGRGDVPGCVLADDPHEHRPRRRPVPPRPRRLQRGHGTGVARDVPRATGVGRAPPAPPWPALRDARGVHPPWAGRRRASDVPALARADARGRPRGPGPPARPRERRRDLRTDRRRGPRWPGDRWWRTRRE